MKIFFPLDAFFPSQIGGPCNTLYWHTEELQKNGIHTVVITTSLGIQNGEIIQDKMIKNGYEKVYYGKGNRITFKSFLFSLSELKNCDIVHLNSIFSPFSILCFILVKLFFHKKALVCSVRGELSENALNYSSWKKKPVLRIYQFFKTGVNFHATSTQEKADILANFKKTNVFEIPNLIRPNRRFIGLPKKKQILFVGRIHPIKALHKIIEGLSLSSAFINSDYKFVIIGKYEDRHLDYYDSLLYLIELKKLTEKIEFVGHIRGNEKEIAYAESYFTLLLSDSENFGNVVLESLNQGTPVIASHNTPWSILEISKCGFYISNAPEKIAASIDKILGLPLHEYSLLRKNAQNLIDNNFDISNQIDKWISKYKYIYNA